MVREAGSATTGTLMAGGAGPIDFQAALPARASNARTDRDRPIRKIAWRPLTAPLRSLTPGLVVADTRGRCWKLSGRLVPVYGKIARNRRQLPAGAPWVGGRTPV